MNLYGKCPQIRFDWHLFLLTPPLWPIKVLLGTTVDILRKGKAMLEEHQIQKNPCLICLKRSGLCDLDHFLKFTWKLFTIVKLQATFLAYELTLFYPFHNNNKKKKKNNNNKTPIREHTKNLVAAHTWCLPIVVLYSTLSLVYISEYLNIDKLLGEAS